MPASSRMRICAPYTSTRIFSTSAGEALPVRTPANPFTTTCSVLIIFSSASSKKSSNAIDVKNLANPFGPARGKGGTLTLFCHESPLRLLIVQAMARPHHSQTDDRRISLIGFHPGLDVFDDLEQKLVGLPIFQAGEPLDVASGAVDELQITGHHPNHVIAHHAPETD